MISMIPEDWDLFAYFSIRTGNGMHVDRLRLYALEKNTEWSRADLERAFYRDKDAWERICTKGD